MKFVFPLHLSDSNYFCSSEAWQCNSKWCRNGGDCRTMQGVKLQKSVVYVFAVMICVHAQNSDSGTRICKSVDTRNSPRNLESLRGCRVVEGYVRVVLIDKANNTDYDQYSFPELREITQYLMFYRVTGLRNISQLFPNLALIRGEQVFQDYALVIYEAFHLELIGLKALTDILRGAVRIEKNPCKYTFVLSSFQIISIY